MKRLLAAFFCALAFPNVGHGWSAPGHKAVALAAMDMLPKEKRDRVLQILGGVSPEAASTWLDDLREGKVKDPAFNRDFPGNREWHFVDYPVGSGSYASDSPFSSSDDVVHALENAVDVMEGKPSPMSAQQAMKVVFHLAGDIHQPLHCSCGFYDLADKDRPRLLTSVVDPKAAPSDRGGNQLYYTKTLELHAMWDMTLPRIIAKTPAELAAIITTPGFDKQPRTPGDYHNWPEQWASDSMRQASEAYKGITFVGADDNFPDPRHVGKTMLRITIGLPGGTAAYKADRKAQAREQLRKAALHLAQLLDSIHFK